MISQTRAGVTTWFHYVHNGPTNVTHLTNSSGTVVQKYGYDAFGSIVYESGSTTNNYRFQTKELHAKSNLVYFGARWYNPAIGRWLTPDPLGIIDGPNSYCYLSNNPINDLDPWGLCKGVKDKNDLKKKKRDIDKAVSDYKQYGSDEIKTAIRDYERSGGTFGYDKNYDGWGYYDPNNNTIQFGHKNWNEPMNSRTPQQEIEDTVAHEVYHWQHNDPYIVEEPGAHAYADEQRTYMNENRK